MNIQNRKWSYLFLLSIIWGSSYILIKKGLEGFSPIQLGAIRVVLAALFLFIIGFKSLRTISRTEWPWVALSGFIGSFVPMFLFAFAETEIGSGIASILNSLVPLFTLFIGLFAFGIHFSKNQLLGVIVGLIGAAFLIFFGSQINPNQNYWYASLVILATVCYASNANIIKSKLQNVSPMGIAVGNFAAIVVPALLILPFSGFFSQEVTSGPRFWSSLGYVIILCIMGTCVAKVMFNKLVQMSSAVFSVSVTYLIPIVGIFWGILDGEAFKLQQLFASAIILLGVYLVNKKKTPKKASFSNS
ncbi:DMT family transporter [Flagellimonas allohymeniacidonis]|uniref:Permease n=1 Tax=Flagellimonas allohymeniacidonis TaxID=2517819 RepID=A0A4Q8QHH0_9FLAO|nr:EamA family transporter [Allomuricauda hymeniacidonis]TAI47879.1 permease [Allomuricauda hymeniacidonis]